MPPASFALTNEQSQAVTTTGRSIIVSAAVNPMYRDVIRTYFKHMGVEIIELGTFEGATALGSIQAIAGTAAAVVVQSPNYFGNIEDLESIAKAAHDGGALAIAACNPVAMSLLQPPGKCGIDIAVGDAQPFGVPLQFGGPWVGVLTCSQAFIRDIGNSPDDEAITRAIIAMAHRLDLLVIAEGVETVEQLRLIRRFRCDHAQGYLLSPPVPAAEALRLLSSARPYRALAAPRNRRGEAGPLTG